MIEDPGEEAIVDRNKPRPKQLPEYQDLMEACFREFHRVLKPGRWMTVEFNNSSNLVWLAIQAALAAAGFVVADTRIFDKEHLSYRQTTATNAVKRDLIISAGRAPGCFGYRPQAASGPTALARIEGIEAQLEQLWENWVKALRDSLGEPELTAQIAYLDDAKEQEAVRSLVDRGEVPDPITRCLWVEPSRI